jgi:hypothetical protein
MEAAQQQAVGKGHDLVPIFMDGVEHKIDRGRETVVDIKSTCGVPASDVIELIGENGQLVPLPDDGSLTIKGDEKFISHKRGGGSS